MKEISNIAVIGAGQLGSRHLQSIKQIQHPINIYVIDPNPESLNIAKDRYEQVPFNNFINSISFNSDIKDLPKNRIDLSIIATNSNGRSRLIKELLELTEVSNIIIEKVLFQTEPEYYEIREIFETKKINAWVNCPRRSYDVYKMVNRHLQRNNSNIIGVVDGSDWGLGCNSIHYIDVFAKLIDCNEYTINTEGINPQITDSKRKGYIEFTGILNLNFKNGANLTIISRNEPGIDSSFFITNGHDHFHINESKEQLRWINYDKKKEFQTLNFKIPYQSQLTSTVATDILLNKSCDLTPFDESVKLHIPFITGLIEFLKTNIDNSYNHCPIT